MTNRHVFTTYYLKRGHISREHKIISSEQEIGRDHEIFSCAHDTSAHVYEYWMIQRRGNGGGGVETPFEF